MKIPPALIRRLQHLLGKENVLFDETSLLLYAYDCSLSRTRPDGVLIVRQTNLIAPVITLLNTYKVPFIARAAATNHAGSCAALNGGFILNLTHLNRLLEINTRQGYAVAEPALITADLQRALEPLGFFYAPDPASAQVCTLGGNAAQNASGARCLKYGGTLEHLLEADVVLPTGEEIHLSREDNAPDWLGLLCGSEGTLGIFTRLKVKILPLQQHIATYLVTFASLTDGIRAVSDLIAQGITPRCVEAMDKTTTCVVENFARAGYPTDNEALLILELDGTKTQIKKDEKILQQICEHNNARSFVRAEEENQRRKLWEGRRMAYGAMARLAPNVIVGDATVARSALPEALAKVQQIIAQSNIKAGLLFHAGDGNFHPHLMLDERNKPETMYVQKVMKQILQACIDCGGTLSGEHGVGVEKRSMMAYQYDKQTLDLMALIKRTLDPNNLANPSKIIPVEYAQKARPAQVPEKEVAQFIKNPSVAALKKLNKVIEIDKTNYTATVQTGITLAQLHKALKKENVFSVLPSKSITLDEAFAGNKCSGFYAAVLGMEAVLPDGSFIRYGGKFMKNASGYPLTRLFAGAGHHFGFVTQITFKIFAEKVPLCPVITPAEIKKDALFEKLNHALHASAKGEQND